MAELAEDLVLTAPAPAATGRARRMLVKRLADVVCLPTSRVNSFERSITADLLVEMLRDGSQEERAAAARRLAGLAEIPSPLLRLLLRDVVIVAEHLLQDSTPLSDPDLILCARDATTDHRRLIARRRDLSEVVGEVLVEASEQDVLVALLHNSTARLSAASVDRLVAMSRSMRGLVEPLLSRAELRPRHAYIIFWWAGPEARRHILNRFAATREVMQDAAGDIFPLAMEEGWNDALVRKALQFIERRQRNRGAIQRSMFDSLEHAITEAQVRMTGEVAAEISFLAGIKPATGVRIFTDTAGESLAVLCKATGAPRKSLIELWRALRRPETGADGEPDVRFERCLATYDTLAVDRAQTVLRYWNWALSSALTPELIAAIRQGEDHMVDEYSEPQRAAMLAMSGQI